MEPNNFEKNIQQKLDELKIQPDEYVWLQVEKRIAKKQDRRRIILFFLLAILLCASALWLWNPGAKREAGYKDPHTTKSKKQVITNDIVAGSTTAGVNKNTSGKETNAFLDTNKTAFSTHNQTMRVKPIHRKSLLLINETSNLFPADSLANDIKISLDENPENLQNGFAQMLPLDKFPDTSFIQSSSYIQATADSFRLNFTITNSFVKNREDKKANEKWHFGITFSAGRSLLQSTPFKGLFSSDYSAFPVGNVGSGPSAPSRPSNITNGCAFTAGLLFEKNIFRRNKFTIGINYENFSNNLQVGQRIDSNLVFYRSVNSVAASNYHNHFEYITVPLALQLYIGSAFKLPVLWQAGIQFSQLIHTNALQYNATAGIYYSDNSMFHKTLFGFNSALLVTFFEKEKIFLNLGPFVSYNPSKLASEGLYSNRHFASVGITSQFFFGKTRR